MSEIPFKIEKFGDVNILVWTDGGLPGRRPASTAEVGAWEAIQSLQSRLAAAERERDEARELIGKVVEHFKKYADHQWGCPVNGTVEVKKNFRTSGPCRCGFEEALALLSGKEK